ncbi:MAG: type II toxin-antitoxin system RelE/ParE family toxin [Pseudomonadota bacterium]
MPGYQLVITDAAELDLVEARQWYQEQAALGLAFIGCVGEQLELIERQPSANPVIAHGIRRAVVTRFPYNIYYAINGQFISILAVWHGSRDQHRLLSQLTGIDGD